MAFQVRQSDPKWPNRPFQQPGNQLLVRQSRAVGSNLLLIYGRLKIYWNSLTRPLGLSALPGNRLPLKSHEHESECEPKPNLIRRDLAQLLRFESNCPQEQCFPSHQRPRAEEADASDALQMLQCRTVADFFSVCKNLERTRFLDFLEVLRLFFYCTINYPLRRSTELVVISDWCSNLKIYRTSSSARL